MLLKWQFSLFDRVENSVGKGENAGLSAFLVFPKCFPKLSSWGGGGVVKSLDCVLKGKESKTTADHLV